MPRRLPMLATLFSTAVLTAQIPRAFEVASVRLSAGPIPGIPFNLGQQHTTADTLTARNTVLAGLIQRAYGIGPQELEGPDWLNGVRIDMVGKSAGPATEAELWAMVRPVLEERFQMKYHNETREVSGLAMVISKKGHKLKVSESGSGNLAMNGGVFTGSHVTVARLTGLLSGVLRRPVRDETGLDGAYDFTIDTRAYADPGAPPDLAGLVITAFREALGLQLEPRKFESRIMVIDHMERTPGEN